MTASLLDRVPVDRITEQARQARPGRVALTVLAGLLFGAAWVTAKALGLAWLALSWCFTAMRLGWHQAHGNEPTRASLREENAKLRQLVDRMNNPYGGA